MTCKLNVSDIGWMILWANIIMLEYASGIEVGNEGRTRSQRRIGSVFDRIVQDRIVQIFR
jgi:hypothetical protein